MPLTQWLRGPLKSWADDLLSESTLVEQGLLNVPWVTRMWRTHRGGAADYAHRLWTVLMLQGWLEASH
ncbi:MAG: hypothetical protein GKR94_21360 [Gammaproteobacteria bacterium]|nr:hypothetical protein [Gammaproteobacteria bacterium]